MEEITDETVKVGDKFNLIGRGGLTIEAILIDKIEDSEFKRNSTLHREERNVVYIGYAQKRIFRVVTKQYICDTPKLDEDNEIGGYTRVKYEDPIELDNIIVLYDIACDCHA